MSEHSNLILAIVLSLIILFTFNIFYEQPKIEQRKQALQQQQQQAPPNTTLETPDDDLLPQISPQDTQNIQSRQALLEEQYKNSQRIRIDTPRLEGSLMLTGARLDDMTLKDYAVTLEQPQEKIVLLSPNETPQPYQARFGWRSDVQGLSVPDSQSVWQTDKTSLSPSQPVTLRWDNGTGIVFEQEISIDNDYLVTIQQRIHNQTDNEVSFFPYGLITRTHTPEVLGYYILHEGPVGVFNQSLYEYDYTQLQEEQSIQHRSNGGWIGITDKYWLTALIPQQDEQVNARFVHTQYQGTDRYQVDTLGQRITVAPKQSTTTTMRLFIGAKEVRLLDAYADQYNIENFDLAIDFGWFYFLTKPFFYLLDILNSFSGNFGIAIILLTILIKVVFYPLADKSYKALHRMKLLQPQILQIRQRYENDKERMSQEVMELYKREKVSPVSGCLPILIQIPVFFALYKVLFVTIEMRHAPFFWWIQDLSIADPTSIFNLFGLIPWQPPSLLVIGIWPILMGLTMYIQQRLNPAPTDPIQARIFMVLPFVFTFILASFPAGLVIYWTWNNILSIAQQWLITQQPFNRGKAQNISKREP